MASTSILLGTLLFYGHAQQVAKSEKNKKVEHLNGKKLKQEEKSELGGRKIEKVALVSKSSEYGSSDRSRRDSIGYNDEDFSRGWDSGSDIGESSSPPLLDECHPLLDAEVRKRTRMWNVGGMEYGSDRSFESGEIVNERDEYDDDDIGANEDDDDEENVMKWTEDDQLNFMNLGTSEMERHKRLENLIARQKALKNMRILAEKNMISASPNLPFNTTLVSTARKNPFDHPYEMNDNILGSAPSVMIPRRNPFDFTFDSSDHMKHGRVGAIFQSDSLSFHPDDPFSNRHERFDVGPSTSIGSVRDENDPLKNTDFPSLKLGSRTSDLSEFIIQRNRYSEDEAKIIGGNETGNDEKTSSKSSSSSFFDVTEVVYVGEDDEEEEFRSIENSSAQDPNELQVRDSSDEDSSVESSSDDSSNDQWNYSTLTSWILS
ncbi:hypothetical protein Tco_0003328 [Tanacetum coccineum]